MPSGKHFVLVLHSGDYLDALHRREQGLTDRYRHHTYAIDTLLGLVAAGVAVTVVQVESPTVYETVESGMDFVGLGGGDETPERLGSWLQREQPTHVMLRFPSIEMLRQVRGLPLSVCLVLADSFPFRFKNLLRYRRLGTLLRDPGIDFVANHHLNSSRQLVDVFGLDPARVVPWDWPLDLTAVATASTGGPRRRSRELKLFYAGSLSRAKGVWDLVEALALLNTDEQTVTLDVAGAGDEATLRALVERHGLAGKVRLHGRVGGDVVIALMQEADFVCVPSRHGYPEGLPLTIYEAMASGTPLVASDHPMFAGIVRDGDPGFVFPAGRPRALAAAVLGAAHDRGTYERVAASAREAYGSLGLSTLWGELVRRWVEGSPEDLAWLAQRSLASRAG